MSKEREIEILMLDGCRRVEAEDLLKKGSVVFTDFEEHFDDYMKDWNIEDEKIQVYRKMIYEKIPATDWGIVDVKGKTYYIMYVL